MTYLTLSVPTAIYLLFSAVQDIEERMIYSFPALMLTFLWAVYSIQAYRGKGVVLIAVWSISIVLYVICHVWQVWGDGDSDIFLLFAGITASSVPLRNPVQAGFLYSVLLAAAQIAALLIGFAEAKIKGRQLDRYSDVAVVPGFTVVLIGLMIYGLATGLGVGNL